MKCIVKIVALDEGCGFYGSYNVGNELIGTMWELVDSSNCNMDLRPHCEGAKEFWHGISGTLCLLSPTVKVVTYTECEKCGE